MMMSVDIVLMLAALGYFFWKAAEEDARRTAAETGARPAALPPTAR